jgi:DNA-binding IclR family transcriptional regulator
MQVTQTMNIIQNSFGEQLDVGGDTPTLRLFSVLEAVATRDRPFTLQSLVSELGLPKPTLHRMLTQLEGAGLLQRQGDGRHYGVGVRLRRLAEELLLNDTFNGARRLVLRSVVQELGESCNITSLSGSEIIYLDRVETQAPLRFYLHPGSRVPVHCSASGKLLLAHMRPSQRRRLLEHVQLDACTSNTVTELDDLEAELAQIRELGYALDREEFLPGLVCVAVLVPSVSGKTPNLCVAVQAPTIRLSAKDAPRVLPALRRAAEALARLESDVMHPREVARLI